MAIGVMFYVLAVANSTTRPRPETMNTSTDSARRDELNYRVPTHSDDGSDCGNMNSVLVAATRQHNNNYYHTARAHHSHSTVSRLSRRDLEQYTSRQRRKPCGDETRSHPSHASKQQADRMPQYGSHSKPEVTASETVAGEDAHYRSPQEPRPQSNPVGRAVPARRATSWPPSQLPSKRDVERKDPPKMNETSDESETPQKEGRPNTKKNPAQKEPLHMDE